MKWLVSLRNLKIIPYYIPFRLYGLQSIFLLNSISEHSLTVTFPAHPDGCVPWFSEAPCSWVPTCRQHPSVCLSGTHTAQRAHPKCVAQWRWVRRCSWTWALGVITIKEPKVKVNRQSESDSCSVASNSLWPHRLQEPPGSSVKRDSPGKNTGGDCHFLLQGIFLTQGSTHMSYTAGRFFTVWATMSLWRV